MPAVRKSKTPTSQMTSTRPRSRKRKVQTTPTAATQPQPEFETKSTSEPPFLNDGKTRSTPTHVFFHGGVLSNWHGGNKIPGSRIFAYLLPELEKLGTDIAHPSLDAFSTRLLMDHHFNCGEQWMMAMKGWFFERDVEMGESAVVKRKDENKDEDEDEADGLQTPEPIRKIVEAGAEYEKFKAKMYEVRCPNDWIKGSKEREMWQSTICQVLRAKAPRSQKALGRKARGFHPELWHAVCMPCVTAVCIARAESDPLLKRVYLSSGERNFVEGSPKDCIWGVGLDWKSVEIEDPSLWAGENRLGKCHDMAAKEIRELSGEATTK